MVASGNTRVARVCAPGETRLSHARSPPRPPRASPIPPRSRPPSSRAAPSSLGRGGPSRQPSRPAVRASRARLRPRQTPCPPRSTSPEEARRGAAGAAPAAGAGTSSPSGANFLVRGSHAYTVPSSGLRTSSPRGTPNRPAGRPPPHRWKPAPPETPRARRQPSRVLRESRPGGELQRAALCTAAPNVRSRTSFTPVRTGRNIWSDIPTPKSANRFSATPKRRPHASPSRCNTAR